jgi:DNA topoisomerase-1
VPTWTAFAVSQLLESHLPDLVDYKFTAEMEDELDAISRGEMNPTDYLTHFYFGNEHPGLKKLLANKIDEIDAREVCRISLGKPEESEEIFIRVGKYGPFLEQGERRASLPDKLAPDELTLASATEMLDKAGQGDEPLGICPDTHKPVFVKTGRFGPYVQRGTAEDETKPQNASLLNGMTVEDEDLATALKLLSLPRMLGNHPAGGLPVEAFNGRYGPYVKCGDDTRSLPENISPLEINLDQAVYLLSQPKTRRGGAPATTAKKEPLKVFEASPVTSEPVRLLAGRYGPYVTDGVTNASLPKDAAPDEITFEYALNLLQARAEAGPSKRRPVRRKAATKKATPVKKKAATKKKAVTQQK